MFFGVRFAVPVLACFFALPAQAIIGGTKTKLLDDVVMILNDRGGVCTATVISPHVVMTSAHCLEKSSKIVIHYKIRGHSYLFDVQEVVRHPGYLSDAYIKRKKSVDLALIKVTHPLPHRKPGTLSVTRPEKGDSILLAGFGQTNERQSPSGDFYSLYLTVTEPYGRGNVLIWLKGTGNMGACEGDSGGPIYFLGKISAVISGASGKGKASCGYYTQGLLVAPQRAWIDSQLSRWHETAQWE